MDKKPRQIVFLTAGLSAGGAEKVTVTLANRLSRSCSVSVICVYPGGVNADYLNAEVNLLRADKPRILAALPFVIRTLKRTRAAFLVCNKDDVAVLGALAIVLSRTDTQLIARVANKPVYYYRAPFWRKFGYYCLFKGMYRYAHRVICVSESLRREILSLYQLDPDKVKVIYNPPGVIRSNPELRPTLTTPESTSVVTIGRLVAQKNHFLFIDTLKALSRVGNYEGFIVGEGPLRSALEAHAAACGIAERIHFVEYVDDPVSYMRHADVFLLTSHHEGLPGSLMHALISGIPVVAVDCEHGVAELLSDGKFGALIPPGLASPQTLADAVEAQISAPKDEASQEALQAHLKRFDIEHITHTWKALLRV